MSTNPTDDRFDGELYDELLDENGEPYEPVDLDKRIAELTGSDD